MKSAHLSTGELLRVQLASQERPPAQRTAKGCNENVTLYKSCSQEALMCEGDNWGFVWGFQVSVMRRNDGAALRNEFWLT